MPPTEKLLDEITFEQIMEQNIDGVCYQLATRGKWLSKANFHSTSFFINRNFLLTSGHNVVKTFRKVNKLQISPSRVGDVLHYGTAQLYGEKHFKLYPHYKRNNSKTRHLYDIALIYIPNDILANNTPFEELNHLPILKDMSSLSVGETVYCAGYPASGAHKGRYQMTLDTSTISDIKDHYFTHKLDTRTGNSGSPIMVKRNENYFAIGINSIKYRGTLINNDKKTWIEESILALKNITN